MLEAMRDRVLERLEKFNTSYVLLKDNFISSRRNLKKKISAIISAEINVEKYLTFSHINKIMSMSICLTIGRKSENPF